MPKKAAILLPKQKRLLNTVGEQIKLARRRRKLSMNQVSERADIDRKTLYWLEKGDPRVSIGGVLRVLSVLGLEKDLEKVAADDTLGRKLVDAELLSGRNRP